MEEIAKKYGKAAVQVALRFQVQIEIVVIPKSAKKERMKENINLFDFSLTEEEMNAIRSLDENKSIL